MSNSNIKRINRSKGILGLVQIEPVLRINRKNIDLNQIPSSNQLNIKTKSIRNLNDKISNSSERILVMIQISQSVIDFDSLEVLFSAQILANKLTTADKFYLVVAVCFGLVNKAIRKQLSENGADELIEINYSSDSYYHPQLVGNSMIEIIEKIKPKHSFFSDDDNFGREVLRRVISGSNLSYATDINHMDKENLFRKYKNNTEAQVTEITDLIGLKKSIPSGELPYICEAKNLKYQWIDIINQKVKKHLTQSPQIKTIHLRADKVDLAEAPFVLSAGNGVQSMDKFIHLADLLGAQVGGSRVVVDDGKLARDKQVGLTGKILDAKLYFSFGISGAIQHLQGIEKCEYVISVNLDPSTPMFKRCNLAIEEDAENILDALIERLTEQNPVNRVKNEKAS